MGVSEYLVQYRVLELRMILNVLCNFGIVETDILFVVHW